MEKRYTANKNYILRNVAGQAILVSVGQAVADFCGIVNLNASAKLLWTRLQESATADELAAVLTENFEISEETAKADVEQTLRMLEERGLVTCD